MVSDEQIDAMLARANPLEKVPSLSTDEKAATYHRIFSHACENSSPVDELIQVHPAVSLTIESRIGILELDDGKANVLTVDVIRAIDQAVWLCELDREVTTLVIVGRPGILSAGLDRRLFFEESDQASETLESLGRLLTRLYGARLRVVTACTGHGIAAGALLLLASDLRIGADGPYKIGMNEAAIGVRIPDWAIVLADQRLSQPALQRTLATGHLYQPNDAMTAGFIDEVTCEDVRQVAIERANQLCSFDMEVYRETVLAARADGLSQMKAQISIPRP